MTSQNSAADFLNSPVPICTDPKGEKDLPGGAGTTRKSHVLSNQSRMSSHIAVLTDSYSLRRLVFRIIEERGWTPVEIRVADLDRSDHVNWDLLVIGATTNTMDAVQLCAAASRHGRTRVLAISSYRDSLTISDTLNAGADDYLVAPFDPVELEARMAGLLSRFMAHQELDRRSH